MDRDYQEHLNFFTDYMNSQDSNIKHIYESIPGFFQINNRKESAKESMGRVWINADGAEKSNPNILSSENIWVSGSLTLFILGKLFARRLGILLSKTPIWPAEIEQQCQIDINDRYNSDLIEHEAKVFVFSFKEKIVLIFCLTVSFLVLIAFIIFMVAVGMAR